nr:hypothetical protein [uncultured Halomonas sp.]
MSSEGADVTVYHRLVKAYAELRGVPGVGELSVSELAERAGFDYPYDVDAAMQGKGTLTFAQLDQLSKPLGVSADWLKHGKGGMYPLGHEMRFSYSPEEAIDALMCPEDSTGASVDRVYFFRSTDERGKVAIVRRFKGAGAFEVWQTPYVLSNDVGGGGAGDQRAFVKMLEALYARYTRISKENNGLSINSFLIDERVMYGMDSDGRAFVAHPLRWPALGRESAWWEDIFDATGHTASIEHWVGFKALRRGILGA